MNQNIASPTPWGEPLSELERIARDRVLAVENDPWARYRLREEFYRKYAFARVGKFGFGDSELAFMRWEIERGVLDSLRGEKPGSLWWRNVNLCFLYVAELASLIHERGSDEKPSNEVAQWLEYFRKPSAGAWYRAHNATIIRGYVLYRELARLESKVECVFLNEVLYRVLYAEAMAQGVSYGFGCLGKFFANPALPAVDVITHMHDFYPSHYPMTEEEEQDVLHRSVSLEELMVDVLDKELIGHHMEQLYSFASHEDGEPELLEFLRGGKPIYPDLRTQSTASRKEESMIRIPEGKPVKIAVLGGGMGSLSTVFELTSYPGWEEKYDITVYQMGWRLGGKMATGRGVNNRIEERGIHIFQGWYNNAFRMMQQTYKERREKGLEPQSPYQEWTDVFIPDYTTIFTEFSKNKGTWLNWPVIFATNDLVPGSGGNPPVWDILKLGLSYILEFTFGTPEQSGTIRPVAWLEELLLKPWTPPEATAPKKHWWDRVIGAVEDEFAHVAAPLEAKLLHKALDVCASLSDFDPAKHPDDEPHPLEVMVELLEKFFHWISSGVLHELEKSDHLRRLITIIEWAVVTIRGMFKDLYDPQTNSFDYGRINDLDYREWLAKHSASPLLLESAPVRFIYTGSFMNLDGYQPGKIAADIAVQMVLISVSYKGTLVWKLKLGTGETVIAPVYQVLKSRGVKFKFFQKVVGVRHSENGSIEAVNMEEQVTLRVPEYDPLQPGGPYLVWPNAPRYEQLDPEQAKRLIEENIDLESAWSPWKDVRSFTLKKDTDYDLLVLGISIDGLKTVCADIVQHDKRWKDMTENVRTIQTVGVQVWLKPTLKELGMDLKAWGFPDGIEPNSVLYSNPLYSWTDMSRNIQQEAWPAGHVPGHLSYYCGTYPEDPVPPFTQHDYPAQERERLVALTEQWFRDYMGWFWPNGTTIEYPQGVNFDLFMHPTKDDADAREKFLSQFFIVNIDPTNRYVIAWPGTNKYRMRADESGYDNLVLAGDWTNFGLNVGHVEGTVISGLRAAQVILKASGVAGLAEIFE